MTVTVELVERSTPETSVVGSIRRGPDLPNLAYVGLRKLDGELVSEVRCCCPADTFYLPVLPGAWEIVCLVPGSGSLHRRINVEKNERLQVDFAF
jgi:hypothetical protein